ncbi:hypothetical protein FB479_11664 [Brevibacillus sp. AG162]|uniref:hypothetical protein n=1 Tax=Brevibacillus sp. AG162 TaxID=2572910 RepID=UPI00115144D0|nr:hypothetical protein [Brevibacillus sp. AG162]TQK41963.1 hypothetical protein FB479_11664 [Brevibacillus sp. AG162]
MTVNDLQDCLGIVIVGTPQEGRYKKALEAAKSHVKQKCNNPFIDVNGKETIPEDVQMGVALVVKSMLEEHSVASNSINGQLTESFFQGATYEAAKQYWKAHRRVGVVG